MDGRIHLAVCNLCMQRVAVCLVIVLEVMSEIRECRVVGGSFVHLHGLSYNFTLGLISTI